MMVGKTHLGLIVRFPAVDGQVKCEKWIRDDDDHSEKHKMKLFRLEDESMGMWVGQFNSTRPVEYVHSWKFCQFGCIKDYYTAHYQTPRQMLCLWDKLQVQGKPQCCTMR